MNITSIVQPSATIARVVELSKGDVYKRVETSSYSDTKLIHGVITEVLANGEQTTVTAIEYVPGGYSSNEVKSKIFTEKDDVTLYPADPTEFKIAVDGMLASQERAVNDARRTLERATHMHEQIIDLQYLEISAPTTASVTA